MIISITAISILVISGMVWLFNRFVPFTVCPVCAGVFLTWVGLLGAHNVGYQVDLIVPALLMGGTVVGIAYQLEKKLHELSDDARLLWKVLFIPAGFVVAYAILEQEWMVLLIAMVVLFLLSLAFFSANRKQNASAGATDELEKKMKDCC